MKALPLIKRLLAHAEMQLIIAHTNLILNDMDKFQESINRSHDFMNNAEYLIHNEL